VGVFEFVLVAVALKVFVDVKVNVGVEVGLDVKVDVAVFEKVAVTVAVAGCGMICMESTTALLTADGPKVIVMAPPEGAILL
jgi:hypothetical protein